MRWNGTMTRRGKNRSCSGSISGCLQRRSCIAKSDLKRRGIRILSEGFCRFWTRFLVFGVKLSFCLMLTVSAWSSAAQAAINEQLAVRALIGEAANQGLIGMTALAEAIRNRGSLRGVFGLSRDRFIDSQPKWVHEQARRAWRESARTNLVNGADHWENVEAFGVPEWSRQMEKTVKIKDHTFWRKGRRP